MAVCCSVRSILHSVNYDSDIDLYPYFSEKKYTKYIPEFHVQRQAAPTDYTVVYRNGDARRVTFDDRTATIEYPWDLMRAGESILYLGFPLIEVQNQMAGMSTVHSAAFAVEDNGVLLLGDAGCGKTSVVMHACVKMGADLVSNDLTLIGSEAGRVLAHGGTKFFHFRKTAVDQNMPWLNGLFKDQAVEPWVDKVFATAEELKLPVREGSVEVKTIYRLHIDNRCNSVTYRRLSGLQIKLSLIEELSRFIRNVSTAVMVGPDYDIVAPIPSFDNVELFTKRRELLESMLDNVGVTYLSGPLHLVLDHISEAL